MQREALHPPVTDSKLSRGAAWAVLGGIVAGYFGLVAGTAWNLPTYDDYGILGFIARVHTGQFSWAEFWAPHNEHRIVWTRVVMLASSGLGSVNFVGLMFIGNLGWLGCGWLLGREAERRSGSLWAAVPVAALLAVPSHQENMLWAMASLQNYWVLFFVLAALLLAAERREIAAFGLFAAALLTSGAAAAALPGLLAPLLWRGEWRKLTLAILTGLALVGVYAIGLHSQPGMGGKSASQIGLYFITFMGGTVAWPAVAPAVGVALAVALLVVLARLRQDAFCGALAIFILVTGGLAAIVRGGIGVEQALASRYALYSLLAAVTVWLACLGRVKPALVRGGGLLLVVAALALSGQIFRSGRWERHRAGIPMEYYKVTSRFPSHVYLQKFLDQAQEAGIYEPPTLAEIKGRLRSRHLARSLSVPSGRPVENWIDHYDGAYVNGWARRPGQSSLGQVVWVVLSNEQGTWQVPAWGYDRPDMVPADGAGRGYLQSGFETVLPLFDLPPGRYDMAIMVWNDGEWGVDTTPFTYGVGVPRAGLKLKD